ncbi:type II toxin-antitoxin system RelE/ParE family toxin [Hydrogenovibrio halophilus]|uniref:type II toxin-antitoxin system RelE/ParE family toxin n=1 Tax=Hydrogenovibrio halophilus TaxID=373391 RepID=UPI0006876589|nr:type II toxin-antitoxin system RelE/ParE family toxin [Hydrogenovibrio halophilus]
MLGERCPFDESLSAIKDPVAKARVLTRLRRLEQGNRGDHKNLEGQLYELRIDVGQGWRVYYKQEESELVLLLIAGSKPNQSKDIKKIKGWLKHDPDNK